MSGKRKPKRANQTKGKGLADENPALLAARAVLRPTVQAAVTLKEYSKAFDGLELPVLIAALSDQTKAVNNGDLGRAEAMLAIQAHTLDAIFNSLARRAINAEYLRHLDAYLKLALRAQSQCRATWETLATIKNPPVMGYVKQANIAHGHQQVNNPPPAGEPTRTRQNENPQNKLLEEKDGEWLDTRTKGTAESGDPEMATVGEIDRAENAQR